MLITAITQQKRDPSRYNIFIDGNMPLHCLCRIFCISS